jgi:hypothetical protein
VHPRFEDCLPPGLGVPTLRGNYVAQAYRCKTFRDKAVFCKAIFTAARYTSRSGFVGSRYETSRASASRRNASTCACGRPVRASLYRPADKSCRARHFGWNFDC